MTDSGPATARQARTNARHDLTASAAGGMAGRDRAVAHKTRRVVLASPRCDARPEGRQATEPFCCIGCHPGCPSRGRTAGVVGRR